MPNSASNPPPGDSRTWRLIVRCARLFPVLLAASLLVPASAWAGRDVRVYDVAIAGEVSDGAVRDAMRRVLVRATGRREAATDPALSALIADAARYVQSSRRGNNGETQIAFDGAALDEAIASAGRSVWGRDRPFTLVVFYPPLGGVAAEAARVELEKAAEYRGLPITLAPVPIVDVNGMDLPREAVLQSARRLGGDAVLVGRGDSAALHGVWQWTLQTSFTSESWTGPLDAGVNGAVDALARVQDASATMAEVEAFVHVAGVTTLKDYAAVERLVESIPGTRQVSITEASGGTATFSVFVRGGADAIDRALSGSERLTRQGTANAQLVYEYHP